MTARTVNGLEVVEDTPTTAPAGMRSRDGQPLVWIQTRTLLLSDGSIVYGCQHCDYTSPNPLSIRPHLNKHKPKVEQASNGAGGSDVDALVRRLQQTAQLETERDQWKARAIAAERDLATLRRVLGKAVR